MTDTDTLFPVPPTMSPVKQGVTKQLAVLDDLGLVDESHSGIRAMAVKLAEVIDREQRAYGIAQASKELRECLLSLPAPEISDMWSKITGMIGNATQIGPPMPTPTFATEPDDQALNHLESVSLVSSMLGHPLLPWQRYAARIITERTDDNHRWKYPLVVITVPRQAGKTYLLGVLYLHRALSRPGTQAWMTAQTGKDATARWKDIVKLARGSLIGPYMEVRRSAGSAGITFPNDSIINPFAPTEDSIHGYTITDASIDEAYSFTIDEGTSLLGAIEPAMGTHDDHQTIIISTAGDPESLWLKSFIDKGRHSLHKKNTEIAYLEWSSQDGTIDYHPALGWTQSRETLERYQTTLPPSQYKRAILNQWVETIDEPLIDPKLWTRQTKILERPLDIDPIVIAYDVSPDHASSSVVVMWESSDGVVHHHTVRSGPRSDWVTDTILETRDLIPNAIIAAQNDGATMTVTDALLKKGIQVQTLSTKSFSAACSAWRTRIEDRTIDHDDDEGIITSQLYGAQTRTVSDGWAISRIHSTGPVDAIIASTVALHVLNTTATPVEPFIA